MSKPKSKSGQRRASSERAIHSVYLDGVTWSWLIAQTDGASAAIRELVKEKRGAAK